MQTSTTTSATAPKPWYREPWPWILMAGPFVAMAGCIITLYLALTNFADEPILEGATRRGLMVERMPAQTQPAGAPAPRTGGAVAPPPR